MNPPQGTDVRNIFFSRINERYVVSICKFLLVPHYSHWLMSLKSSLSLEGQSGGMEQSLFFLAKDNQIKKANLKKHFG